MRSAISTAAKKKLSLFAIFTVLPCLFLYSCIIYSGAAEKPVVTTNNGLFLVSGAAVQNQQNSRFNVGLYRLVVVLRPNTYK